MPSYHSAESLAQLLGNAKRSGEGWECICPAHDDSNPSLWIVDAGPGRKPKIHCRAHCEWDVVQAAISSRGLSWDGRSIASNRESSRAKADRRKDERRRSQIDEILSPVPDDAPAPATVRMNGQAPTLIHEYRDKAGRLLRFVGRVDRTDGKQIRPYLYARLSDGRTCWVLGGPDHPSSLYGLDRLAARPTAPVLIVEGEKTADAAATKFPSHVVVTWQGGANAVGNSHWQALRDRDVTLWADADDAGAAAMTAIAGHLQSAGATSVRRVSTLGLPAKWDLADTPPQGMDIAAMLENAEYAAATTTEQKEPQDRPLVDFVITADELVKMDLPQREYLITPFLSTNSLNMIYAERGLGKTWFCLSLALSLARGDDFLDYLVERPCPVLYIDG